MADLQIAGRWIRDPRILAAMAEVPRHLFVPPQYGPDAYADTPLPIGNGQTISQPYIVALMTELLHPGPKDRVLELGAGSGYQAAILGRLTAQVVSIERIGAVAAQARANLAAVGAKNVEVIEGDGTQGYPPAAPYNGILVTAASPEIPGPLTEQLADNGRLVAPVGERAVQDLVVLERHGDRYRKERRESVRFVPLIGKYGWEN